MKVVPLSNRVLVKPKDTPEKTAGGIYIPDTAKEKTQEGTIVAVGNGKEIEQLGIKADDIVLFDKYAGDEIKIDGKKHLLMMAKDIMATLR
ncbi:co-chaperone GroES [Candidatus Woesearchaeota archaeon CG_4_10_14_0_2_um_filter_57_5]|nr:MAG: co-chaperone GroES [Candidatus Woesearchaeota archaeon CG1_02_57_44]PIN68538.1 MAG: co-chaperone GroES [Candidatus Woesearchaeota archaeon CG11_big_fil_rev_8_21_14_0_20_57_5]PIZ52966.1 MAG: co-chaperone GroES [Candidatus Woesearchaeota archaeon CG_4_10_14_0_2_um_filter_57_5]